MCNVKELIFNKDNKYEIILNDNNIKMIFNKL